MSTTPAPVITSIDVLNGGLRVNFTQQAAFPGAEDYQYSFDGTNWIQILGVSGWSLPSPTPTIIAGLTNGETYSVRIRNRNEMNEFSVASNIVEGTPSSTAAYPTQPAPVITGITSTSNETISVAFTQSTNQGPGITNYKYALNGSTFFTALDPPQTSSPIVISNLPNRSYTVKLKAVNLGGDSVESNSSTSVVPVGRPSPPSDVNVAPGDQILKISFSVDNTGGAAITAYKYSLDGINYTQVSSLPLTISNLVNDTSYTVYLKSVNQYGDSAVATIITATPKITWKDKGQPLIGFFPTDSFGNSVSLNSQGTVLAIGGSNNDGPDVSGNRNTNDNRGVAVVYDLSGNTWVPKGDPIYGVRSGDNFGFSVSLNSAGNVLAVGGPNYDGSGSSPSNTLNFGHARVYDFSGNSWVQRGDSFGIEGVAAGDSAGVRIKLNGSGNIIAVGAIGNDASGSNSGHVRVFQWTGTGWTKLGSDINGVAAGDQFGAGISLSDSGYVLAAGAQSNDGTTGNISDNRGHVRVFEYNLSQSEWIPKGSPIVGEWPGDLFGASLSLDSTGNTLAIGAERNRGNSAITNANVGHVRVFQWSGSAWAPKGDELIGEKLGDQFSRVSLNSDGTVLAVGAYNSDGVYNIMNSNGQVGRVTVYNWAGSTWTPKGTVIDGERLGDQAGISVSLSADGNILAVGMTGYDGPDDSGNAPSNTINRGQVRVYYFPTAPSSQFLTNISTVGVNTTPIISAVQSLTLSASTPTVVNLQSVVTVSTLPTVEEKKAVVKNTIEYIFEQNPTVQTFKVNPSDILLSTTNTNVTETLVIRKDSSESNVIVLDTIITPTTSVYAPLTSIEDKSTVSYNNVIFSFEKSNTNEYTFTDGSGNVSTLSTGQILYYNGLRFEFGGVNITKIGSSGQVNVPVTVNLDVTVDANGNIQVLGAPAQSLPNVIVAGVTLPVNALYDASGASIPNNTTSIKNGLFEFWEPSGTVLDPSSIDLSANNPLGQRQAAKATTGGRDFTRMTKKFVCDLQTVLEGSFDCSQADPFKNGIYNNNPNYTTQLGFGRLALSTYAHYLFGHVAATTAITNDQEFINAMLSRTTGTGADATYKYGDANSIPLDASGADWPTTGAATDADLAVLLVGSILKKADSEILKIVNQVLGQDASRAMDEDNNELAPNIRQVLKFIAGDVIYMNIKLQSPVVTVGTGQQVQSSTLDGKYSESSHQTYTLKITLGAPGGFAYTS
jgi:hypothetical protein